MLNSAFAGRMRTVTFSEADVRKMCMAAEDEIIGGAPFELWNSSNARLFDKSMSRLSPDQERAAALCKVGKGRSFTPEEWLKVEPGLADVGLTADLMVKFHEGNMVTQPQLMHAELTSLKSGQTRRRRVVQSSKDARALRTELRAVGE